MSPEAGASGPPAAVGRAGLLRFLPLLVVLAGLGMGYALGLQQYLSLDFLADSRDRLEAGVAAHPVAAPLVFAALYALAVAFSFPAASVLTVFSGFLFGWLGGGLIAVAAATVGATALFLAARSASSGFLRERAGASAARVAEAFRRNAFGTLLAMRLAPFIPFVVVNVVPALCGVRSRTFVLATFFGIMPGAFAYAWLGEGVDSVLVAARAAGRSPRVADLVTVEITVAFALLALVAALAVVLKRRWNPEAK